MSYYPVITPGDLGDTDELKRRRRASMESLPADAVGDGPTIAAVGTPKARALPSYLDAINDTPELTAEPGASAASSTDAMSAIRDRSRLNAQPNITPDNAPSSLNTPIAERSLARPSSAVATRGPMSVGFDQPMSAPFVDQAGQAVTQQGDLGPLQRRANQVATSAPAHVGWKERIGRTLLGLATGNVAGAAVNAIAPQWAAGERYKHQDIPEAQAAAQREAQLQGEAMRRRVEAGGLTGIDPETGQQTEPAKMRETQMEAARAQHETANAIAMGRLNETSDKNATTAQTQRAKTLLMLEKSGMGTPETRAELADALKLPRELQQPFIHGDMTVQTDAQGNFVGISKRALQDGKPAVTQTGVGSNTGRVQTERERADAAREKIAQQNANTNAARASTKPMSPADAGTKAAEELGVDEGGTVPNPKWKSTYDAEWNKAKANGADDTEAAATAQRRAAKAVKEGERIPVAKHPAYQQKVRELRSTGQAIGGGQPAPTNNGQVVIYNGHKHRVIGKNPTTGKLQLDPNPLN